jgi:hypothetical protein
MSNDDWLAKALRRDDLGPEQPPNLTQAIEEHLSAANDSFPTSGVFSVRDMHTALCVMQRQQRVPVTMLARLWGLQNDDEATKVVTCMSDFSVVDTARGEEDGVSCVTLDDLVHDV